MPTKELDKACSLVSRYTGIISSTNTLEELAINLQSILDSFIDVEYDGIYFFNDEKKCLELIYAKNFTEEERLEAEKTAMDRHPGYVYKNKKTLHIPDTNIDKSSKSSNRSFEIKSRLFIPILIEKTCVGTLGLASSKKNNFSDFDIKILSMVCSMAAMRFVSMKKEKQIKAKDEQFRQIIENTLDAHLIMSQKGIITYWNKQAEVIFGWKKDEIMGKAMHEYIMPEKHISAHNLSIDHHIKTGEKKIIGQRIEIEGKRKNGDIFPIELLISSIKVNNEKFFSAFIQDISKKKEDEGKILNFNQNLQQEVKKQTIKIENQNNKLSQLALFPEHNPNPVIELDLNFKVIYRNPGAKKHFKISPLLNSTDSERRKYEQLLKATIDNKETGVYSIEEGFRYNGKHYDFNLYIDRENNLLRLYFNDITDNIKLQYELKEQRDSIFDSLNYAQKIQRSILPDLSFINNFFEDHFVLYQPKDIVSGDFYWATQFKDNLMLAMCDCTGHGVPGAFMSIIGHNAINDVIKHEVFFQTSDILNALNSYFYKNSEKSIHAVMDSMDMIFCHYNKQNKTLNFSGCLQQFYLIRDGEIQTHRTDKIPLGLKIDGDGFGSENVVLHKGDLIYLFSDGYPDQFGGPRGKKFKYKPFRDLLLSIHEKPMAEQQDTLKKTMLSWRKDHGSFYEQIDDISIIGLKI